jgi:hypothetical protein
MCKEAGCVKDRMCAKKGCMLISWVSVKARVFPKFVPKWGCAFKSNGKNVSEKQRICTKSVCKEQNNEAGSVPSVGLYV